MASAWISGLAATAALSALTFGAPAAMAGGSQGRDVAASTELSAQSRQVQRSRPRIRITPNQPDYWLYPRPGEYSYPGPNAYRDCVARLEPEWRPSGTVIVPRTRCWWVRG